jgi:hypothetical protein
MSHVLEFEGARYNATGDLKPKGDAVQFQRDGRPTVQVNISSIQDIVLICPYWIPHIYVIRQLVIIESFWWFATYKICRNHVLSANDCRKKHVRVLRAIE